VAGVVSAADPVEYSPTRPTPTRLSVLTCADGMCRQAWRRATGVVVVSLATLPDDLPSRDNLNALQAVINRGQAVVDAYDTVTAQADNCDRASSTRCEC
jgi:hypothetical protein